MSALVGLLLLHLLLAAQVAAIVTARRPAAAAPSPRWTTIGERGPEFVHFYTPDELRALFARAKGTRA